MMTVARSQLIHPDISLWYHCISGCVRGAFLFSEGSEYQRKRWIEERLRYLAEVFTVSVGSYAILDSHMHLVLGLEPERLAQLSDNEVLDRWYMLFPPKGSNRKELSGEKLQERRDQDLADIDLMNELRRRIGSISWFHKQLKEPLSKMINKEEGRRGTFFEGRFKSIAVADRDALVTTCVYVDLNVVAAGLADSPEASDFTAIKARIDHVRALGRLDDLAAAQQNSVAAATLGEGLNTGLWLAPIEEPSAVSGSGDSMGGAANPEQRKCVLDMPLGTYVWLVEYSGRIVRNGKASISDELAGIFERLGTSAELWQERLRSLTTNRLLGRFFASTQERLDQLAAKVGQSRVMNLAGAPVK